MVQNIFKGKKGKDFYRNDLAYLEYDPDDFTQYEDEPLQQEDEEIAFHVAKKIKKEVSD
jgi:hypothetical protein